MKVKIYAKDAFYWFADSLLLVRGFVIVGSRIRFVGTRCIAFLQIESITIGQRELFYYLCRSKI